MQKCSLLPNGSFCMITEMLCCWALTESLQIVPSDRKLLLLLSSVVNTFKCNRMQNCYLSLHQQFRFAAYTRFTVNAFAIRRCKINREIFITHTRTHEQKIKLKNKTHAHKHTETELF